MCKQTLRLSGSCKEKHFNRYIAQICFHCFTFFFFFSLSTTREKNSTQIKLKQPSLSVSIRDILPELLKLMNSLGIARKNAIWWYQWIDNWPICLCVCFYLPNDFCITQRLCGKYYLVSHILVSHQMSVIFFSSEPAFPVYLFMCAMCVFVIEKSPAILSIWNLYNISYTYTQFEVYARR